MSTTIRVSLEDKERLERLARRFKAGTMSEALRKAIELAEQNDEKFRGNLEELTNTLKRVSSHGLKVSMKADEALAQSIE